MFTDNKSEMWQGKGIDEQYSQSAKLEINGELDKCSNGYLRPRVSW